MGNKICLFCKHSTSVNGWDYELDAEIENWYCDKRKIEIEYDDVCNDFEEDE